MRLDRKSQRRNCAAGRRGACAAAFTLLLFQSTSLAQVLGDEQIASDATTLETVVVTAQRRFIAADPQRLPIALSVITGAQLDDLPVRTLQDLGATATSVTLVDAGTVPGYANFTIRGLGINTSIPSTEPTVGLFVDGIYVGTSAGAVLHMVDIESVEILRLGRPCQAPLFILVSANSKSLRPFDGA